MKDARGRKIDYMRISITDRCNLRCKYCMPNGIKLVPMEEILTMEEILRIVRAGVELGITHIKITGGEPLVRKNCCELVRAIKQTEGIEKVTITTNGVLLERYLDELVDAGIDGINISLDTINSRQYEWITGKNELANVLQAIEKAVQSGVSVKINTVSMEQQIERDWMQMLQFAKNQPIDVRFIEMMPIGYGKKYKSVNHILLEKLRTQFPEIKRDEQQHGFGPAVYYKLPGYKGSVGMISAIHGKFCSQCNRIRLTSMGKMKTCLCYDDGADLMAILRSDESEAKKYRELVKTMQSAIMDKPEAHCFEKPGEMTECKDMVQIGG